MSIFDDLIGFIELLQSNWLVIIFGFVGSIIGYLFALKPFFKIIRQKIENFRTSRRIKKQLKPLELGSKHFILRANEWRD